MSFSDVLAFVVSHARRQFAILDRECSAKTAAGGRFHHLVQHDIGHAGQQRARLFVDIELA
jgi:hypothetical protein